MMEHTDRHFRCLMRMISEDVVLWTEMVKDTAIVRNADDPARLAQMLDMSSPATEPPVVLQLGGSDPASLAEATKIAGAWGYSELNLNCGCPSPKTGQVRDGAGFGVRLMESPELARDCADAMADAAGPGLAVSVKCRIGTHPTLEDLERDGDDFDRFAAFVDRVASGGRVRHFVVHARSGILSGLSPTGNRRAPPLRHDFVYRIAAERPGLHITLNGGVDAPEDLAQQRLRGLDVMVGRWALRAPWDFASDAAAARGRGALVAEYLQYCRGELEAQRELSLSRLVKPLVPLFSGVAGNHGYRQELQQVTQSPRQGGFDRFHAAVTAALAVLPHEALQGR